VACVDSSDLYELWMEPPNSRDWITNLFKSRPSRWWSRMSTAMVDTCRSKLSPTCLRARARWSGSGWCIRCVRCMCGGGIFRAEVRLPDFSIAVYRYAHVAHLCPPCWLMVLALTRVQLYIYVLLGTGNLARAPRGSACGRFHDDNDDGRGR